MKVDLKFLIEQKKPDWIPQETWDGMSDTDKQKMSKTEDTIETIRNQDKNVAGTSPTSDNLQDYLNKIDQMGQQARETGQEIGDIRNRELAKDPKYGERLPTATDPTTGRSDTSSTVLAPGTSYVGGHLTTVVPDNKPKLTPEEEARQKKMETDFAAAKKITGGSLTATTNAILDAAIKSGKPVDKLSPDELAAAKTAGEAQTKQRTEDEIKRATERKNWLQGKTGKIETASGQTIDVDQLLQGDVNDPAVRTKLLAARNYYAQQAKEAAEEKKQAKGKQQPSMPPVPPTPVPGTQTLPSSTGASGVFGGGQAPAAPTPATTPATTPKGTTEGTPTDAATHGGVQISSATKPPVPLNRSQEDKIRIAQMRDQSLNQPVLTQGVARRAITGGSSSLVASSSFSSSTQRNADARYGARRATASGVQAIAESYRFGPKELSSLLESATGSPFGGPSGWDWLLGKAKDVKKAATTKTTTAGVTTKRTLPIALQDLAKALNPLEMKHPVDRTPVVLGQAGYSRGKGIRTVQQLMKNPVTNVLATLGGAPSASQLSGLVGLVKSGIGGALLGSRSKTAKTLGSGINVAGNIAQDLLGTANTPEAEAARAIQVGAMLGDPRIVKDVTVSDVLKYRP